MLAREESEVQQVRGQELAAAQAQQAAVEAEERLREEVRVRVYSRCVGTIIML